MQTTGQVDTGGDGYPHFDQDRQSAGKRRAACSGRQGVHNPAAGCGRTLVKEIPWSSRFRRCFTASLLIIWLTEKCLPMSLGRSVRSCCQNQSQLFAAMAELSPQLKSERGTVNSVCGSYPPTPARYSSVFSLRSAALKLGSPIRLAARPPAQQACVCHLEAFSGITMGTRCPKCKLSVVDRSCNRARSGLCASRPANASSVTGPRGPALQLFNCYCLPSNSHV